MSTGTEPFPELFARDQLKPLTKPNGNETKATRRRKSSGLGQEIRAGDTGAPAIATLDMTPPSSTAIKVRNMTVIHEKQILTSSRHRLKRTARNLSRNGEKQRLWSGDGGIMHSNTPG